MRRNALAIRGSIVRIIVGERHGRSRSGVLFGEIFLGAWMRLNVSEHSATGEEGPKNKKYRGSQADRQIPIERFVRSKARILKRRGAGERVSEESLRCRSKKIITCI